MIYEAGIFSEIATIISAFGLIGVVTFVLYMLFDCVRNEKEQTLKWILIILFFNIWGALAYYFYRKKNRTT